MLAKFEGREEAMIRQLKAKYGDEPLPPQASQPAPPPPVSMDNLFATAQPATAVAQAPEAAPTPVVAEFDPFAVPPQEPTVAEASPPAAAVPVADHHSPRSAADIDAAPAAAPPATRVQAFPPMAQSLDPKLPASEAMTHNDDAGKPAPKPAAASPPKQPAADDDFDAFLNSRLQ